MPIRRSALSLRMPSRVHSQRGMFLIEALVAVLLFMLGILGIVGVSGYAVMGQSDAQYRTMAASLAAEMTQQAWLSVARSANPSAEIRAAELRTSLEALEHQPGGDNCDFSGTQSTAVQGWVTRVKAA
ncbi:MAG: hypothetical protein EOO27_36000, partial [Comamonadaceae bacterium]